MTVFVTFIFARIRECLISLAYARFWKNILKNCCLFNEEGYLEVTTDEMGPFVNVYSIQSFLIFKFPEHQVVAQ